MFEKEKREILDAALEIKKCNLIIPVRRECEHGGQGKICFW